MIYVQHLLGIGHLRRALVLAAAIADAGLQADLVTGGMPVFSPSPPGVKLHQLPPVRSLDGSFDKLVDESDKPIDEMWKMRRRDRLLALFIALSPHAIITETFPFGRRMMRFELLPLLEAASRRAATPLLATSIRDILQPKSKPGRNAEICALVNKYYDKILVHGDERVATLGSTFPLAGEVADKTCYTGYITEAGRTETGTDNGDGEVLVSAGGGAAGLPLLKTALAARSMSTLNQSTWRLLVGGNIGRYSFEQLRESASAGIVVERNRTDFAALLKRCTVSISQAGYNTAIDVLKSGARAVMVPFAKEGEIEQTLRARLLRQRDRIVAVDEENLTPEALAVAVDRAAKMPKQKTDFKLDGASVSAQLLVRWLDA